MISGAERKVEGGTQWEGEAGPVMNSGEKVLAGKISDYR